MALELPAFLRLAAAVKAASGLNLPREQQNFIEARLQPAVRRLELRDAATLIEQVASREDPVLLQAVFEALAATETSFFRDKAPFDQIRREIVPALAATRTDGRIRIWCAGCATGQEAYSMALVGEQLRADGAAARFEILGTDLSERCLEKAAAGLYTQFEVQRGLPIQLLLDWFEPVDEMMWRVSPRLRQRVDFRRFNLMDDPAPMGTFDLILFRNVLPGLDEEVRQPTLERLASVLAEDGRLVMGLGETVHGLTDVFRPVPGRRGLYARNPDAKRKVA